MQLGQTPLQHLEEVAPFLFVDTKLKTSGNGNEYVYARYHILVVPDLLDELVEGQPNLILMAHNYCEDLLIQLYKDGTRG